MSLIIIVIIMKVLYMEVSHYIPPFDIKLDVCYLILEYGSCLNLAGYSHFY